MSSAASVSLTPDQIAALNGLARETVAFSIDIAEETNRSLRVVTLTARPGENDEDTTPIVRMWTVSVAGTVREVSPLTSERAAA